MQAVKTAATPLKPLLKVAEVARLLNFSAQEIYRKCAKGEIPHRRIGGAIRFDADELAAWLQASRKEAA